MKKLTVSILFLITLAGLHLAAPAATAMSEPDEPDEVVGDGVDDDDNESLVATQDQNAAAAASTAATTSNLGAIQVGPSASGEALRILSTAYTLQPLSGGVCPDCIGVVVSPGELFIPWIVDRLKTAYEAGHGVALTHTTAADIERLRNLLRHHGSLQHNGNGPVDLVAFRKAQRTDGQFHFSSHVLLSRTPAEIGVLTRQEKKRLKRVSGAVRRKLKKKLIKLARLHRQHAQAIADQNDVKSLGRVLFSCAGCARTTAAIAEWRSAAKPA